MDVLLLCQFATWTFRCHLSLADAVINSSTLTNLRIDLIDIRPKQEMMYNYKAELAGILNRSYI